jgi:hypothetical protein
MEPRISDGVNEVAPEKALVHEHLTGSRRQGRRSPDAINLHVCPVCESGLVEPTDWTAAGEERWTVSLRCPECEWVGTGTYSQDALDRLEDVLDEAVQSLLSDLRRLTRANMEEHVQAFSQALQRDLLLPEDF